MEMRLKIAFLSIMAAMSSGIYASRIKVYNYTPYTVDGDVSFQYISGKHPIHCQPAKPDANGNIGPAQATMDSEHCNSCIHDGMYITVTKTDGSQVSLKQTNFSYISDNAWYEIKEVVIGDPGVTKLILTYAQQDSVSTDAHGNKLYEPARDKNGYSIPGQPARDTNGNPIPASVRKVDQES